MTDIIPCPLEVNRWRYIAIGMLVIQVREPPPMSWWERFWAQFEVRSILWEDRP